MWLYISRKSLRIRIIQNGRDLDVPIQSTRSILTRKVRPQTHISQAECILRVWNIEGETHKICIEMNIQIQELEYVVRLQPEKIDSKDQFDVRFRRIMKVRQDDLNLNR